MESTLCPCGSNIEYCVCCGLFHSGTEKAPTAEALMRSRYSAFANHLGGYLVQTLHPSKRRPDEAAALEHSFKNTQWEGLTIINKTAGSVSDTAGSVEFIACYRSGEQKGHLHERSRFVKESDQWFYVEGEMLQQATPGRNDPCWCGSGKKFKKCHG